MPDGLRGKAVGSSGGGTPLELDQRSQPGEEREPRPEEAVRPEGTAVFGRRLPAGEL